VVDCAAAPVQVTRKMAAANIFIFFIFVVRSSNDTDE
jgi:hypothetical protein